VTTSWRRHEVFGRSANRLVFAETTTIETAPMKIYATLPEKGRDLRLDLFRGIANWAIFLDHIPDNIVNWITTRNYGFSDAADLFVFISGYTASFVYARMMIERGFIVGATRLTKRVWQLYVAHIILLVIYIVAISYLARRFGDSELINEFNVAGLVDHATDTLGHGLLLQFKPVNLDVLPLYIVLMGFFPPVLWIMLRQPDLTMLASIVLWLLARHFGWNFLAYPVGTWYFDPYCWQVIFVFGSWCALGGAKRASSIINSKAALYLGVAYLIFALIMTFAGRFPSFGAMFPQWLYSTFNPNDKTFMAPYRFLHFIVIAMLVVRFIPKNWPALEWKGFDPAIVCGQQSLAVFCVGVFLSFVAHFVLTLSSGSLLAQVLVSLAGIALMTTVAYYISWSKRQDKPQSKAAKPAAASSAALAS
jgi:hypothetical protein